MPQVDAVSAHTTVACEITLQIRQRKMKHEKSKAVIRKHGRPLSHDMWRTSWPYATALQQIRPSKETVKEPYTIPEAPSILYTRSLNDCAMENNGKRISKNVCLRFEVISLFLKQDITFSTRSARDHECVVHAGSRIYTPATHARLLE